MKLPKYLVVEWPSLGTRYYQTANLEASWLIAWIERETYYYSHVTYLTNEEPAENVEIRLAGYRA